jgi:hypothetical protein
VASPDLDLAEYYVTVRNWSTLQPYIDTQNGRTTQAMPYEAVEIQDLMYEANANSKTITPSSAKITLPSLYDQYELKTLFQNIQFGDRVEIFNFQPDCGDPIFAGYIPSEGITQDGGKLSIDVLDPFVRGQWHHVKKIEQFNDVVANLYTRGLASWVEVVNEDFSQNVNYTTYYVNNAQAVGYTTAGGSGSAAIGNGSFTLSGSLDADSVYTAHQLQYPKATGYSLNAGDTFLIDVDVTLNNDFHVLSTTQQYAFLLMGITGLPQILLRQTLAGASFPTAPSGNATQQSVSSIVSAVDVNGASSTSTLIGAPSLYVGGNSLLHRCQMLLRIDASGYGVATFFVDQMPVGTTKKFLCAPASGVFFELGAIIWGSGTSVVIDSWRVRKLSPYLAKSPRFKPQSSDVVYYQANNEQCSDFFALWLQKDNTEYRINYRAAPQVDTVDVDLIGTLGINASQQLGYEQVPLSNTPASGNVITPADASDFEGGVGGWTANSNCSVTSSATKAQKGTHSLRLSSTAGGAMSAVSASGTSGFPVQPNTVYRASAYCSAGATPQLCSVGIANWYDSGGSLITTGTFNVISATDNTTGWTALSTQGAGGELSPSNAAFAQLQASVNTTAGAAELHYFDNVQLYVVTGPSVDEDAGSFLGAPPFRFEEGYNIVSAPKQDSKALAYANSLVITGSGAQDAQIFDEVWSTADIGNPAQGIAGKYPTMEMVSNNDKVSLMSIARQIAVSELAQHVAAGQSITIEVSPSLEFTGRWRAGDTARLVTRALLTNIEADMRIMKIQHRAGSPIKTVTLGRQPYDTQSYQRLQDDMLQSWLFDLSGSSSLTYVYVPLPTTLTGGGASSAPFPLPVDQFTAQSVVVGAYIHWFVSAGQLASNVQAVINGSALSAQNPALNDSGVMDITSLFQGNGVTILQFQAPATTTTLQSAFVTLRIRI